METKRAYLVEIGGDWLDLSRVERIESVQPCAPSVAGFTEIARITMASGAQFWVNPEYRQELIDKLASFRMLADQQPLPVIE
jgi:hypothetical protein